MRPRPERWNADYEAAVAAVAARGPRLADLDVATRETLRGLLAPIVRGGTDVAPPQAEAVAA